MAQPNVVTIVTLSNGQELTIADSQTNVVDLINADLPTPEKLTELTTADEAVIPVNATQVVSVQEVSNVVVDLERFNKANLVAPEAA